LLVQRQPDGTFAIAEYGKLVLQLSSSLEFVSKHKEYFSTHDIMRLPFQFVNRIGELWQTSLIIDTVESLNKGMRAFSAAEEYGWGIGEGTVPENMGPVMSERIQKGVKLRLLLPENRLSVTANPPSAVKNLELRSIPELPALIVLTEKEALVSFRNIDGRMDYAGFSGTDPIFHNWVRDLFLYYWEKGKRT
jgi:predicted transcriptional regulator